MTNNESTVYGGSQIRISLQPRLEISHCQSPSSEWVPDYSWGRLSGG